MQWVAKNCIIGLTASQCYAQLIKATQWKALRSEKLLFPQKHGPHGTAGAAGDFQGKGAEGVDAVGDVL